LSGGADTDDNEAVIDLTRRVDGDDPDTFQRIATGYLRDGKLKSATFTAMVGKNRTAFRDDAPGSPYKSGRALVSTTLDPGQLLSGGGAAIARAGLAQALIEYDNWTQATPNATRADSVAMAQSIIKRYQFMPYEDMKKSIGLSPYFGGKTSLTVTLKDIEAAESALARDIRAGGMSKSQQEFEIRRLNNWRDILIREEAASRPLPKPDGK
jgi:hypothetical protein